MASLIAALGTVEHDLLQLLPPVPRRAFFNRYRKLSPCDSVSRSVTVNFTTDTFSRTSRRSVGQKRKMLVSNDRFSYNCTNVYPHVEEMEMFGGGGGGEDNDDNENGLARLSLDLFGGAGWSDSDSDESCYDSSGVYDDENDDDDFMIENHFSYASIDQMNQDELLIEFGRKPCVFDYAPNMTFYISPVSISHLATGLCTRSRPACVIINTSIPRGLRFDDMDWSEDSLRMLNTPNAGGSSLLSEVLSCEMLNQCLGATLAKTEMEIKYLFAYQPITDYTITLPNLSSRMHIGVSVTRAFAFKGRYTRVDCRKLLIKKLRGILASTRNVIDERFLKQILHVWVPNGKVARTVQATYKTLPLEVTRNTVVIISVVNAPWVFSNRR
ncbi:hypothetical protein BG004_002935 [Podila humilis]|nr:hypothetical protein BG004_002935 [Podila humilis]